MPLRARLVRLVARRLLALRRRGDRKIVFLLMNAWGMGGTIRATLNIAGHLARDHDVEVISLIRKRRYPFFPFPPGVTVTAAEDRRREVSHSRAHRWARERLEPWPSVLMDPADRASATCTLWTDVRLLHRLWRARPAAIVGTRLALNALAAQVAAGRVAAIGQDQTNLSAKGPARRRAVRERYHGLDALVVLTERDARTYRELLPEVRLERIPNTVRRLDGGPSPLTGPVVLGAGRLTRQKGFDRLVLAWGRLAGAHPDWRLRICGDGPRRLRLQQRIDNHGLRDSATLVGRVRNIEQEMLGASIFVLSSRYEGFPLVLLEAMSMGLAVVSFDCPTGPREVVEHDVDGLLVPDGDVGGLAGAIAELIEDEERRRRLGAAAVEATAEYGVEGVGRRWQSLLAEMRGL